MGNVRGLAMRVWNRACAHVTPRYAIQMYRNGRTSNLRGNCVRGLLDQVEDRQPPSPSDISRCSLSLSPLSFTPLISFVYQSIVPRITARMMKPAVPRDRDINPDRKISETRRGEAWRKDFDSMHDSVQWISQYGNMKRAVACARGH